jgi:hypothetical protein
MVCRENMGRVKQIDLGGWGDLYYDYEQDEILTVDRAGVPGTSVLRIYILEDHTTH